jgi:hypothetical protein
MLWALFSQGNLSIFLRIFKLVSQVKADPFVVRPVTTGEGAGGVGLESKGRKCGVDDLRESVLCLADTEVSSAKTEVCDC